jgi:trehalose 6-phosphate phosphatase
MNWALGSVGVAHIQAWLQRCPLLAFDFDGTLAPIVANPADAAMSSSTTAQLSRLALQQPCVVISGRARADLKTRLRDMPLTEIIGNHGSEPWLAPEPLRRWTGQAVPLLRTNLAHLPGVDVEDKDVSISIHYRRAFARAAVIAAVEQVARLLGSGTLIRGKYVINLLPPMALDKGQAVLRLKRQMARTHMIYVGDDVTDEHAFVLGVSQGVLGIRVGRHRGSHAALYLKQQGEIDQLLDLLCIGEGSVHC